MSGEKIEKAVEAEREAWKQATGRAPKLTPLELLKKRPMPVFDVVHGADNPGRKPSKAPPQKPVAAVKNRGSSLVKELLPAGTIHSLQTLKWRLERAEARK